MGVSWHTSTPLQPLPQSPSRCQSNPVSIHVSFQFLSSPLTLRLFLTGFALKQHSPHAPELLISPLLRVLPPLTPTLKLRTAVGGFPVFRKLFPCPISPLPAAFFSPQPATAPPVPVRPRRRRAEAPRDEPPPEPPASAAPARLPQHPQPGSLSPRPPCPFLPEPSPPASSPPGQPARHRALRHGTSGRR